MARTLAVQQSRVIPVSVDDAFAGTLPIPLTTVFSRWYGPIGPVKEVRDQHGEWDSVGQTRTVLLSPTGSFHEELTSLDPPHSFGYALTGITGPLGLLVGRAEGAWTFVPSGTATTITWSWNIHAASGLAGPFLPVLGRVWKGYARQSLATLSAELTR
jgi:Polyketide cyclase / dehydrase and lipid transport